MSEPGKEKAIVWKVTADSRIGAEKNQGERSALRQKIWSINSIQSCMGRKALNEGTLRERSRSKGCISGSSHCLDRDQTSVKTPEWCCWRQEQITAREAKKRDYLKRKQWRQVCLMLQSLWRKIYKISMQLRVCLTLKCPTHMFKDTSSCTGEDKQSGNKVLQTGGKLRKKKKKTLWMFYKLFGEQELSG